MDPKEIAAQKARDLVEALRCLPFSSDRKEIIDIIGDEFHLACGGDDGHDCWCDYNTPVDED